jgi:hypothetical protein
LIELGPQVPERRAGDDRQAAEVVLLAEKEGQVAEEALAPGQGPLGQGGPAQDEVEEAAVLQDPAQQPVFQRPLLFTLQNFAVGLFDEVGEIDARGTDRFAGLAVETVLDDGPVVLAAMVKVGEDEADGPDIDVAVVVAAHQAVDGADVGAGAAAHTAQGLGKDRVPGERQAAVIQKDDVHLFLAAGGGTALVGPGDPGDVRGDDLAGGPGRQNLQDAQGGVKIGQQFVHPHQGHVDAGQGGGEAGVAFVADDAQGAGRGDGEVGPRDPHVRGEKGFAQLPAGHLHQVADVSLLRLAGHLGKKLGDLLAGEVDGGHDHVGGAFVAQLDDPLPQVRFHHLQALGLQVVVQKGLLRSHGLGFDDLFDLAVPGDGGDDFVGLPGGGGQVHPGAGGFGLGLKSLIELFQAGQGLILAPGDLPAQALHVHPLIEAALGFFVGAGEIAHGGAQKFIIQGLFEALFVFFEIVGRVNHDSWSLKRRTWSSRGPWTPMVRTRSMSAVREAPVMKAR